MSSALEQKILIRHENCWLDPDKKSSKTYSYVVGTCCHCKDDIFDTDEYKTVSEGLIHKECIEEYMDEIWSELAVFEKYDLLKERGII